MLGEMRRYMGIGFAWLGATVLSVMIAAAAVAGIRDRVVETPVAIGVPSTITTTMPPETVTSSSSTDVPSSTVAQTTSTTTSTTTTPPVTTTTIAESSSTTAPPATTTTTTTVPPPTTTTTTTVVVTNQTYDLIGGTVTLAVGNGEVNLVSAVPRPGFDADYEHTGPKEVEIKFESQDHKSKLEAKWESGELEVDIEEEPHGDGDDDHDH